MVTGFVRYPGSYRYFPGYTIQDYLGLAGGVLETGTHHRIYVNRGEATLKLQEMEYVLPGDQIYVPEDLRSRLFGTASIVQIVTAITSLYLAYIAATR
jgi:protein involved in polysaccharide export with SLBB domain